MREDDFDVYKLYMTCLKDSAMTLVLWFSSSLQVVKVTFFFSNSHISLSWKDSLLETALYCNKVHDSSHLQGHFFRLASVNCCSHFQKFE